MYKVLVIFLVLFGAMLGANTLSAHGAHEKNPYIVHRQSIYNIVNGHMRALQAIILLDHPATSDIAFHANAIKTAFQHQGDAFPKGSEKGSTHANSKVWEQPEKFSQKQREADLAVERLVKAAEQNDQSRIKQSFGELGKACRSCHDDFRKKM